MHIIIDGEFLDQMRKGIENHRKKAAQEILDQTCQQITVLFDYAARSFFGETAEFLFPARPVGAFIQSPDTELTLQSKWEHLPRQNRRELTSQICSRRRCHADAMLS